MRRALIPSAFHFQSLVHKYSMNDKKTQTNITDLLHRRIRRHDLKPSPGQFDGLFRDFLELWQKAETEAANRRVSRLRLLDGLDALLLGQVAKRNDK
jgi:hypothetical protein